MASVASPKSGKQKSLQFDFGGKRFEVKIQAPSWDFGKIQKHIKARTELDFPKQCHIEIDSGTIDSDESLKELMNKCQDQHVPARIKQMGNEKGSIRFHLMYYDNECDWDFQRINSKTENRFDIFWGSFIRVMERRLNINGDDLFDKVILTTDGFLVYFFLV